MLIWSFGIRGQISFERIPLCLIVILHNDNVCLSSWNMDATPILVLSPPPPPPLKKKEKIDALVFKAILTNDVSRLGTTNFYHGPTRNGLSPSNIF